MLLVLPLAIATSASGEEPLFPFVITYDAPQNVTNVSAWVSRPAGPHGFLRAVGGRLADDRGPVRLWATNLCGEACFPEHRQAERVAARLASLGINCVRLHHMDGRSIWGNSPDKLTIDPEKLERLDYLIYQFKQHGIYANINLHVSRSFGEKEGFSSQQQRPKYDKGLDNFEPRMIELQKKYARDLLTHVNPYTKAAYTSEPAVAMIEINNENSFFSSWNRPYLDDLPEPYATTYRKLWNDWLRRKYQDTATLKKAWQVAEKPLGEELLANAGFTQPVARPWNLQRDAQTQCDMSIRPAAGPDKRPALVIRVDRGGRTTYIPQFFHGGLKIKKDEPYTLNFWLKADKPRQIGVNCVLNHAPWSRAGLSINVEADSTWKQHSFAFVARYDDDNARITFSTLGTGTVELASVSFRPGGVVGLADSQRLEDNSVPPVRRTGGTLPDAARADFADFMWQTEHAYWLGMYRFLKDELRVRSPISGTQMGYGLTHVQADLDYIDAHSYWQHPRFPGKPWDPKNWDVRNIALVNSPGGTLTSLAGRRVAGMAYTVSEYNHPAPNQYAGEGFPMIAAFGAFQAWDGIFSFAYGNSDNSEPRKLLSYFDIESHTAKIAHMPACAAMFLRGDVAPARKLVTVPMPLTAEHEELRRSLNQRNLQAETFGLDPFAGLRHAVALDLCKGKSPLTPSDQPKVGSEVKVFVSDTGQIRWDASRPGKGCFLVDSPRTKLFTGFVDGRRFDLGPVGLAVGSTRLDWCTISLVCIDGEGVTKPGRILLAATGLVENEGAKLEQLDGDRVTLRNHWGKEPVMCEGITADISLPIASNKVEFYSLDESGRRKSPIQVTAQGEKTILPLRPSSKTVWYEIVAH
jgi:hypothetical protein